MLRINVRLLVEGANPRHEHEWRVWEHVKLRAGRKLIPGVISHATNIVEHPGAVAERAVRLARLVGPENVIASTDCGFAQGAPLPPRSSVDHVGEAGRTGRGSPAGVRASCFLGVPPEPHGPVENNRGPRPASALPDNAVFRSDRQKGRLVRGVAMWDRLADDGLGVTAQLT